MKQVVVWDSKNNLYVNKYKRLYFAFAIIFVILTLCCSISFICVDWNNTGTSFDLEDIFIGLFLNLIMLFFIFIGYIQIKLGLESLKYDEQVILTYYPMMDIKNFVNELNPNEIVFTDSRCVVTSNDKRGFDILSFLFSLNHSYDFESLFNKLDLFNVDK